jgi:hypothetical protein
MKMQLKRKIVQFYVKMVCGPDSPKIFSKVSSPNTTSTQRISFLSSVGKAVKLIFENVIFLYKFIESLKVIFCYYERI